MVPTPAGALFTQSTAQRWGSEAHLVFACGRYEGIDQRVIEDAATRMRVEEVSIGDYVLPGGESAALVMIEAVVRLLPNVLGNPASHQEDSHSDGVLEGPSYTRPPNWRGLAVPEVLLSGDHARVQAWRREASEERTRERRPDLWDRRVLGLLRSGLAALRWHHRPTQQGRAAAAIRRDFAAWSRSGTIDQLSPAVVGRSVVPAPCETPSCPNPSARLPAHATAVSSST